GPGRDLRAHRGRLLAGVRAGEKRFERGRSDSRRRLLRPGDHEERLVPREPALVPDQARRAARGGGASGPESAGRPGPGRRPGDVSARLGSRHGPGGFGALAGSAARDDDSEQRGEDNGEGCDHVLHGVSLSGYAPDRRRPAKPRSCRPVTIRSRLLAVEGAVDGIRVETVVVAVAAIVDVRPAAAVQIVGAWAAEDVIHSALAEALVVPLAEAEDVVRVV